MTDPDPPHSSPVSALPLVYSVVCMVLVLATAGPFLFETSTEWDEVYAAAGDRLKRGEDLYPRHTAYTYPPFMAAVAMAIGSAGPTVGRVIWLSINLLAGGMLLRWGWSLARSIADGSSASHRLPHPRLIDPSNAASVNRLSRGREGWIFVLGLLCGLRYLLNGFAHLQTDVVIAALMFGGCWELTQRRPTWSGILFGLATAIKGPAALWLGYLLFRRQGLAAGAMIVTTLLASFVPDLIAREPGGSVWLARWLHAQAALAGKVDHYPGIWASTLENNQSLAGFVCRATVGQWEQVDQEFVTGIVAEPALSPSQMKRIIYGVELVLGLVTLVGFLRQTRRWPMQARIAVEGAIVLTLIVLVSPMSSKPHFAVMMLPGWLLARSAIEAGHRSSTIFLSLALVGLNIGWNFWGDTIEFFALWSGAMTWGTFALWGGLVLLLLAPGRRTTTIYRWPMAEEDIRAAA